MRRISACIGLQFLIDDSLAFGSSSSFSIVTSSPSVSSALSDRRGSIEYLDTRARCVSFLGGLVLRPHRYSKHANGDGDSTHQSRWYYQQWTFDVRGDEQSDIAAFQHRCRELDIPLTLTALHALTPLETQTEAALTEPQQEALVLAYQRGYFESPREVTMEEIGEQLGISQQVVASRLRRGIKHILGSIIPAIESPK